MCSDWNGEIVTGYGYSCDFGDGYGGRWRPGERRTKERRWDEGQKKGLGYAIWEVCDKGGGVRWREYGECFVEESVDDEGEGRQKRMLS